MIADPLPDGTYRFTVIPLAGPSYFTVATVRQGRIHTWATVSRDGSHHTPMPTAQIEAGTVNLLGLLRAGIETARRLAHLGFPQVEYASTDALPLHNPSTGTVYVPVQIGEGA